jgi:hypothetical protein
MVVAHVIHDPHEPLVEHRHRLVEQALHGLGDRAPRGRGAVALGGHLLCLLGTQAARVDAHHGGLGRGLGGLGHALEG